MSKNEKNTLDNPHKSNPNRPGAPKQVQARIREKNALQLRIQGLNNEDIAKELGIARTSVGRTIKNALAVLAKETAELGEEYRELQLQRVDQLIEALWEKAAGGHLPTVDRINTLMRRQAALAGVDAPVQIGVTANVNRDADAASLETADLVALAAEGIKKKKAAEEAEKTGETLQ